MHPGCTSPQMWGERTAKEVEVSIDPGGRLAMGRIVESGFSDRTCAISHSLSTTERVVGTCRKFYQPCWTCVFLCYVTINIGVGRFRWHTLNIQIAIVFSKKLAVKPDCFYRTLQMFMLR